MKIEKILDKLENKIPDLWGNTFKKNWIDVKEFLFSLNLTDNQFKILLVNRENKYVEINIKKILAKHPDLPDNLKYKLAKDKNVEIKKGIAERPDLPEDLIYKLYEDKNISVKETIIKHPNLPENLMCKSIEDKDNSIRKLIGQNPELPMYLVIKVLCTSNISLTASNSITTNNLKLEDLIKAYDLISVSKYINRKNFEFCFNYIADEFPELSEFAKMFKRIILNGKNDLL